MHLDWKSLVKILVPIIIPFVNPKLAQLGPVIANGINEAEQIPGASGSDKLAHVTNIATQAATGINTVAGKEVVNPDHLEKTVQDTISTVVDVTNLIHKNQPTE